MILTAHQLADLVVVMHTRQFTRAAIMVDTVSLSGHPADPDSSFRMEWRPEENRWFFSAEASAAMMKDFFELQNKKATKI